MWEDALDPVTVAQADPRAPHLHILLAMDEENLMAGMVWEYYPVSNCVLVCTFGLRVHLHILAMSRFADSSYISNVGNVKNVHDVFYTQISYMVVNENFRGRGLMSIIQDV